MVSIKAKHQKASANYQRKQVQHVAAFRQRAVGVARQPAQLALQKFGNAKHQHKSNCHHQQVMHAAQRRYANAKRQRDNRVAFFSVHGKHMPDAGFACVGKVDDKNYHKSARCHAHGNQRRRQELWVNGKVRRYLQ